MDFNFITLYFHLPIFILLMTISFFVGLLYQKTFAQKEQDDGKENIDKQFDSDSLMEYAAGLDYLTDLGFDEEGNYICNCNRCGEKRVIIWDHLSCTTTNPKHDDQVTLNKYPISHNYS